MASVICERPHLEQPDTHTQLCTYTHTDNSQCKDAKYYLSLTGKH